MNVMDEPGFKRFGMSYLNDVIEARNNQRNIKNCPKPGNLVKIDGIENWLRVIDVWPGSNPDRSNPTIFLQSITHSKGPMYGLFAASCPGNRFEIGLYGPNGERRIAEEIEDTAKLPSKKEIHKFQKNIALNKLTEDEKKLLRLG